MLLYHLNLQIKGSTHHFDLVLRGDDAFSEDGDWTAMRPGELYLGESDGYWELRRQLNGRGTFVLYDKENPSAFRTVFLLSSSNAMLASLFAGPMGVILDQRHKGTGTTWQGRGSWEFTWTMTQRFF